MIGKHLGRADRSPLVILLVCSLAGCESAAGDGTGEDAGEDVVADVADAGDGERDTGGEEATDRDPVPDFAAVDLNPESPTFGEERSPSGTTGKVILLYFASFT